MPVSNSEDSSTTERGYKSRRKCDGRSILSLRTRKQAIYRRQRQPSAPAPETSLDVFSVYYEGHARLRRPHFMCPDRSLRGKLSCTLRNTTAPLRQVGSAVARTHGLPAYCHIDSYRNRHDITHCSLLNNAQHGNIVEHSRRGPVSI